MIDRESVAEAIAWMYEYDPTMDSTPNHPIPVVVAAARAWLDQGDALVIRRDENGNWPESLIEHVARGIAGPTWGSPHDGHRDDAVAALDALSKDALVTDDMIDRGMEALDPMDRDNLHRDGVRRILMAALSDRSDKP